MKNLSSADEDVADSNKSGDGLGILEEVRLLSREIPALMQDHLTLAALETRQAGEALVKIIALGLIAACLLFSGWMALTGMVALALIERNVLTGSAALLLLAVANGLAAALIIALIRQQSRKLLFSASVSSLHTEQADLTKAKTC